MISKKIFVYTGEDCHREELTLKKFYRYLCVATKQNLEEAAEMSEETCPEYNQDELIREQIQKDFRQDLRFWFIDLLEKGVIAENTCDALIYEFC